MPEIYVGHISGSLQFRIENVLKAIKEDRMEKAELKQAYHLLHYVVEDLEKLLLENGQ